MEKDNEVIKIIVIGDSLVGKTSFIHRYVNNTYRTEYKSTIGVDFALKIVPWEDPGQLKVQLWDIAGQERFTYMTRAYYRDANGCILMFDLSNPVSFAKVKLWKEDLDSKARLPDGSYIPCLLVGSKCDLSERRVSNEEIFQVCKDFNFVGWTETSSKEDVMIQDSVRYLLDIITGKTCPYKMVDTDGWTESVKLHHGVKEEKKKKCAC